MKVYDICHQLQTVAVNGVLLPRAAKSGFPKNLKALRNT
jgi:hypothetical protein